MIGTRAVAMPAVSKRQSNLLPAAPALAGCARLGQYVERSVLMRLMFAMFFIAVAAVLYLQQAGQASVLEYNIAALQSEQLQLNMRNANLHASATDLQAPQRIESMATGQLQMLKPDPSNTIWNRPLVPRVAAAPPPDVTLATADRVSSPLAWISRTLSFIKSSL